MDIFNPYWLIIEASFILILSYFFGQISQKTKIPSVLLLIFLGILLQEGLSYLQITTQQFFPILELLGIVGLILIVLEAALDLELTPEKRPLLLKALWIATVALLANTLVLGLLIKLFFTADFLVALLYAVPLSITSSAIVIPSIGHLDEHNREFLIFESTFSDIIGIMLFYFLIATIETPHLGTLLGGFTINFFGTIFISFIVSYLLILLFQRIQSDTKLFLLIAVLMMIYSMSKLMHLSSLLIILVFGLILKNPNQFFFGFLKRMFSAAKHDNIFKDFKLITMESTFVIRTFFFVIFGVTISLSSLLNIKVVLIALSFLVLMFVVRFFILKIAKTKKVMPDLLVSPRGLITILLFMGIPKEFEITDFQSGIVLFVIILSSSLMAIGLARTKPQKPKVYTNVNILNKK